MPGGGLTQRGRQRIVLGPADGLAYAETARRLDRPTRPSPARSCAAAAPPPAAPTSPGAPAGARLESISRFPGFVSESTARAAEQTRGILHAERGEPAGGIAEPAG
ncbi:hypothetical protein SUDANB58_02705 [Streptomyces sp. enrichment culture]